MNSGVLLASGGLDSTTLAHWLVQRGIEVIPIFFDYGQHCAEKEWQTLQRVLPSQSVRPPERISLAGVFRGSTSRLVVEPDLWHESVVAEDLYVPYRTLLFMSLGAACAQSRGQVDVYSGFINSNHAKELDCTTNFLNNLDELAQGIGPVRLRMPFRHWSKAQVVAEAVNLGVKIGMTYSCQVYSDIPCGACPNCVERLGAIADVRQGGS